MLGKVGQFIQETRQELNKVTWPTRVELWQATLVVLVTSLLMAFFVGGVDFVLAAVMRVVLR